VSGTAPERRVLLVEDEPSLAMTVGDRLTAEGYAVETVSDGLEAERRAREQSFDVIVLDVALPGKNGFDVCRDLRADRIGTPILMLTARSQVVDRVLGLKLGADDYLTKPFEPIELLARIEALLRRQRSPAATVPGGYGFGDVRVDFRRAEVLKSGERLELSGLEFKLLRYFIEQRGAVLSRSELLEKVWGYHAMPQTRTVDVHVGQLRQKLEDNPSKPEYIVTVHRMGYRFTG
jgi:two-component system alkaline phosphatase synthesis response regulator PhoP